MTILRLSIQVKDLATVTSQLINIISCNGSLQIERSLFWSVYGTTTELFLFNYFLKGVFWKGILLQGPTKEPLKVLKVAHFLFESVDGINM